MGAHLATKSKHEPLQILDLLNVAGDHVILVLIKGALGLADREKFFPELRILARVTQL